MNRPKNKIRFCWVRWTHSNVIRFDIDNPEAEQIYLLVNCRYLNWIVDKEHDKCKRAYENYQKDHHTWFVLPGDPWYSMAYCEYEQNGPTPATVDYMMADIDEFMEKISENSN